MYAVYPIGTTKARPNATNRLLPPTWTGREGFLAFDVNINLNSLFCFRTMHGTGRFGFAAARGGVERQGSARADRKFTGSGPAEGERGMLTDDGIKSHLGESVRIEGGLSGKKLMENQPLRLELFSTEQRRERGRILGQEHMVDKKIKPGDQLLNRLKDNAEKLGAINRTMVDDVTVKRTVPPVGEWLVDNFYVVEEQISLATRHLPKKYLTSLPALKNPNREGLPRVYDLAEHIIAFGDGRVDIEDVTVIVNAYQECSPLKLGELWAIPIMLRLALIENVRRLAVLADEGRTDREEARHWADAMIRMETENPKNLILVIADMARETSRLPNAFVAEFKRRLQGRSAGLKLPLQWVEQNLAERNTSIEQAVNEENHRQAQMEVSMRNSVNSLRSLNVTDWSEFVESLSLVESKLREDPADVYSKMDFATRDRYRRTIERLAAKSNYTELEVADKCVALSRDAAADPNGPQNGGHVGYFLIGPGRKVIKSAIRFRGNISYCIRDSSPTTRLAAYLLSILGLTIGFTAITTYILHLHDIDGVLLWVLTALLVVCTAHLSVGLVNFAASLLVKPRILPRMNYAKGIPPEMRTLVVTPVMISSAKGVTTMLNNLESHYLSNRGPNIHFGLLTDFTDAEYETCPDDEQFLALAKEGIEKLNERYPSPECDNFFLFHRARSWNEMEKIWMGHERKRGKLEDLNRYLRSGDESVFACVTGESDQLRNIKYVITLDADTVMARDSAWQMVGTMAHPLTRPVYDEQIGRVVEGHGILQPRVDSRLAGANRSLYARMQATEIGIDPYTRASSDVYQDLFDEGSFIGKGIYDVEIFDRALGRRFPDNKILSHDLIEGCVVRSGLLSDVKVYEDPPSTYLMDMDRRHRWVRGDWQIASYLTASEPRRGSQRAANPLNMLSQWKIFDNLRRSITAIVMLVLLLMSFSLFHNPGYYVLVVVGVFTIPVLVNAFAGLVRKSPDKTFTQHLANLANSTLAQAVQAVFRFACLPYEAYVCADAIVRSLWRQLVSKRGLLQWQPSDNRHRDDYVNTWQIAKRMWIGPFLALAMTAILAVQNPRILPYALPLFALWFFSPSIVSYFSRPRRVVKETLTAPQVLFLRKAARRTWKFFEDFVTAEENWLPPDNYQEHPVPRTAHRTSPTNMGLSLLANLSACDFGFITQGRMLFRMTKALGTMLGMERFRGHFYNWYDTRTLHILRPTYISTVDSGNLCAHLIVLAAGMRETLAKDGFTPLFEGFRDTLELAIDEADNLGDPAVLALDPLRRDLALYTVEPPKTLDSLYSILHDLAERTAQTAETFQQNGGAEESKTLLWLRALAVQVQEAVAELDFVAPWAKEMAAHPEWKSVPHLNKIPTLIKAGNLGERLCSMIDEPDEDGNTISSAVYEALKPFLDQANSNAEERVSLIHNLALQCENLADVEYDFLYDRSKRLLSIGYNVDDRRLDASFYDLLASEARLACYVGVAQHRLPQASWFALGRMLTRAEGHPLLVSWSGSMFEYLMPLLVMPSYDDTLLAETYKAVVAVQIAYGKEKNVPWGISESGFYVFDSEHNYQYRAFGVPELGLKHGLSEDLVIAPYATALAAMVAPARACKNLEKLAAEGCLTSYGFYEAIDYTPSRVPRGGDRAVIRSYMAHHQGMSLVALAQALLDRPMHRRFEKDPMLNSATLLLQEMVPAERALYYHSTYSPEIHSDSTSETAPMRVLDNPSSIHPEVQLLSNGKYHVMISAAGGGYSRFRDIAVTRWREDPTLDNWGTFCYIRDQDAKQMWSNTLQPTLSPSKSFTAVFAEGRAEFMRRGREVDTRTEIAVSPEDDVEVRRIRLHNHSAKSKVLDITSFAEVALATPNADDSHQAFSKLFIQTKIIRDRQAIICSRRPRTRGEHTPLMFHMMVLHGSDGSHFSYETDRRQFIGRGNTVANPSAVCDEVEKLSDTEGAVLDPITAIRAPVKLETGENVVVDLITGVADDEHALNSLIEKYHDPRMCDKAFDLAWTHGQLLLHQQNISETDAQLYCRLAGSIIYPNPSFRAEPALIVKNRKGQSGLWSYAISGDLPIVLLKIDDPTRVKLVDQMLQAHTYWRQKGLKVDLVIWNENETSYRQSLHDQILGMAGASLEDSDMERPGGIFIRSSDRINDEDRTLMQTVARIVLTDDGGMLEEQIRRLTRSESGSPSTVVQYRKEAPAEVGAGGTRFITPSSTSDRMTPRRNDSEIMPKRELILENGLGGFTSDGKEYVIVTDEHTTTPLPWINVIANENFGTFISESGSSCTWAENSHEFRITPWQNDPVSDSCGEAIYLRDEQSGEFWSPTPLPCRGNGKYTTRHGFGYSVFEHKEKGINSEMSVYIDPEESIKFYVLKVRNSTDRPRGLSAVAYAEWVLGDLPARTRMHVVTGVDSHTGALFARNLYNDEFRGRTVFLDSDDPGRTVSGDRREFLGRNGTMADPAGLQRANLPGRVGPALDPCGAVQVRFGLAPGQERKIIFRLGVGKDVEDARRMVKLFRGAAQARLSLEKTGAFWGKTLGTIQVETPDQAFNVLANGWLMYQSLSCRFWGRNALYQSGGAYGYRDQLQDSMALVYSHPELVREHLLRSAAHQFIEGDVMHWWHPPSGRGVRTRCSDDYLWLPYVVDRYVKFTGDMGVLDEEVDFLRGRPLKDGEESYYDLPAKAGEKASLYEHCRRAIAYGLRFGKHGIPLMGSGDWCDGMDRVGIEGTGESVWLGMFLHTVMTNFAETADKRNDFEFAKLCRSQAEAVARNIEAHTWDEDWYRRAYFDDGTPLGSASNPECRIDSLPQSWSVISGLGDPNRAVSAMRSMYRHLVDSEHKIIKLLEPPFDKWDMNPGYIKGYVPGVRENGGQYTHGAIWSAIAFAKLKDRRKAWELYQILNPVNHALTRQDAETYMVEPYVITADVYGNPQHMGRGGWSWYTGSASWLYRLMVESLLGLQMEKGVLKLSPCVPVDWDSFTIRLNMNDTVYTIEATQSRDGDKETRIMVDGANKPEGIVELATDAKPHQIGVLF